MPTWTRLDRDPQAYRNLAYLERAILRPAGIVPKLTVAGDLHHYSRYEHRGEEEEIGPTHKITSGGGGAFLHPTHVLPARATIGVDPDDPDDVTGYEMEAAYPSRRRSRMLSASALGLALRNPSFCAVPAVVALALLWSTQFGLRTLERPGDSWSRPPPAGATATWPPAWGAARCRRSWCSACSGRCGPSPAPRRGRRRAGPAGWPRPWPPWSTWPSSSPCWWR